MRFDSATGIAYDHRGNTFTSDMASPTAGSVGEAALLISGANLVGSPSGVVGRSDEPLAVECMVDLGQDAYAALTAGGSDFRWCPVVHLRRQDGSVQWALGFFSYLYTIGSVSTRQLRAGFFMRRKQATGDLSPLTAYGPLLTARPGRFVHLAACTSFAYSGVGWDMLAGCWFDGLQGLGTVSLLKDSLQPVVEADSATQLRIGGSAGRLTAYTGGDATIVPFTGAVDELRVTAAARYDDYLAFSGAYSLPSTKRVIPSPNY